MWGFFVSWLCETRKQSNDTLYTFIRDSYYLVECKGSSGVEDYFANTIVNIVQIRNIRFVNVDLEEGSHVAAGVWRAMAYNGYKIVK